MRDAVQAGGKPAVRFKDPQGDVRFVPADRTADAVKSGGTLLPIEDQDIKHPGLWHSIAEDFVGAAPAIAPLPAALANVATGGSFKDSAKNLLQALVPASRTGELAAQAPQQDAARKAAGYSLPYRAAAPIAQAAGANVPGMEHSAAAGDVGGVAGHFAAAEAPYVAGAAAPALAPFSERLAARLPDAVQAAGDTGARAVRAATRGANKVLAKAPGTVGGAAGAAVGGYLGGHVGAEVGGAAGAMVGRELLPQVKIPGEGFGFPNRVTGGPEVAPQYEAPAEGEAATEAAAGAGELDATGENRDYAGAPAPKPAPVLDATGENKPFAGGMDEYVAPKPKAPGTIVTDPATGRPEFSDVVEAKQQAAAPVETKPAPVETKPAPAETPAAQPAQKGTPAETPGPAADDLLGRLRQNAAKIQSEEKTAPGSADDDLTQQLEDSLALIRARKAAQAAGKAPGGASGTTITVPGQGEVPRFVYRARDIGEQGVPAAGHAQAGSDLGRIMQYAEAGQRSPMEGQVVRIDLAKLKPQDFTATPYDGGHWIKFTRPLSEDEVTPFAGQMAGAK